MRIKELGEVFGNGERMSVMIQENNYDDSSDDSADADDVIININDGMYNP